MKKMGFNIEGGGREKDLGSEYHNNGNKAPSPSRHEEMAKFSMVNGHGQNHSGHSDSGRNYFPKTVSSRSGSAGKPYISSMSSPSHSHNNMSSDEAGISVSANANNLSNSAMRHATSSIPVSVSNGSMDHHINSKVNSLAVPRSIPQTHNIHDLRQSRSPTSTTMNDNRPVPTPSVPSNESELQLYRVLQRANLLRYFDVMIELGGDDVQQLCEAGEEEFLEIMALIGMASKPLHVRRLQKALQEWMTQPSLFQAQAMYYQAALPFNKAILQAGRPFGVDATESHAQLNKYMLSQVTDSTKSLSSQNKIPIRPIAYHSGPGSISATTPTTKSNHMDPSELKNFQSKIQYLRAQDNMGYQSSSNSNSPTNNIASTQNNIHLQIPGGNAHPGISKSPIHNHCSISNSSSHSSGSLQIPSITIQPAFYDDQERSRDADAMRISADQIIPSHFLEQRIRTRSEPNSPSPSVSPNNFDSRSSLSPIPFLQDVEVQKIAEAAIKLIRTLPTNITEPRMSARKKSCEDFEAVIRVPEKDPKRMEEVRKFAAVYGRFDCKRKLQKPLTLHELSVNEAAAQLCKHIPALLTRRDELFPLARQIVRDAGLPYSTNANLSISLISSTNNNLNAKSNHDDNGHNGYNGFNSKRLRLDVRGIEIHEYHRPPSNSNESIQSDDSSVQISPMNPPVSPSMQIVSPHERVTITSVRKKHASFPPSESPSESDAENPSKHNSGVRISSNVNNNDTVIVDKDISKGDNSYKNCSSDLDENLVIKQEPESS